MELRAVEIEDAELFYRWENDTSLWEVGLTRRPISRFAIEQYVIEAQNESFYSSHQIRLMIDVGEGENKRTVGCIDVFDFEPTDLKAAVGVLIDQSERGKGYSKQAILLLWEFVSKTYHLNQLYSLVACDNTPSKRMFLATGFEHTATLRSWIKTSQGFKDVELYQKIDNQVK